MASRRKYVTATEVNELCGTTPADVQISEAEELIDAFVGFQEKFVRHEVEGLAFAGDGTTVTLESVHRNSYQANHFTYCEIEIVGGTGAGQRRTIASSTYAGVITVDTAWTTAPDSTSFYHIYQLGKYPRSKDAIYDSRTSLKWYKSIPEAIKRATAAQVEYMIEMGEKFFANDKPEMNSERIGDYSYSKSATGDGGSIDGLISPKAKQLLRGYRNRKGVILV